MAKEGARKAAKSQGRARQTKAESPSGISASGAKKPLVIYYTAAWCAPCRTFGPLVEKLAEEIGIDLVKVDVDDPPVEYKSRAGRVRGVPLLVAEEDGTRRHGAMNEADLRKWLQTVKEA